VPVVRGDPGPDQISWDPPGGRLASDDLAGVDAVVHLAGAGIGDRRWSEPRKRELVDSRVTSTQLLSGALAALPHPPAVLISGSAVGYYGDRGDEELTEESGPGAGFLADLCRRWEGATSVAEQAGIRVVHLRSGVVLGRSGGALAKQLPLFRLGLGGRLGSGHQYTSWISLTDEIGVIMSTLADGGPSGAVNATAPNPVTNASLAAALGRALHRPAFLSVPAFALRLAMGTELADEMLLAGQRALPAVLLAHGYHFAHTDIDAALEAEAV
jgi:hypothetical protein